MLPWWSDVTIVQSDITIVVLQQLSTGSKHDYLFCYFPLMGILFDVVRIMDGSLTENGNTHYMKLVALVTEQPLVRGKNRMSLVPLMQFSITYYY